MAIDAMLIRANAAFSMVNTRQLDGLDALCMIVDPGEELLEASLSVVRGKPPTRLATQIAARLAGEEEEEEPKIKRGRPRLPELPRQISLDELLAVL